MKNFVVRFFTILFFVPIVTQAQYISTSETVPYTCPSVCAGGTLVLKIFQLQNLTSGAPVQAVLSNSTGGFGSGTTTINCNRYSTSSATGPWINGPYTFSSNASNVFFEFTIPATATPATGYTVHFKSGATVGANMQMPCTGFTITPSYTPLAALAPSTYGNGQWIAHAYTWTPTTGAQLNTAALVAAQNFFDPLNYKGHFLKNSLSFNLDYTPNGGKMPGSLTVLHDGTSFQCGDGYSTNFSLRFYRTENFAAGLYQFEIQGDDGIRLSIDGGLTWILNSFLEQAYAGSMKTTATLFPNGVCLSGPTPLVIEYFQRPADAHIRFSSILLSPAAIAPPKDSIVCAGQNAAFSTTSIVGATYQWQVSTNGGATFNAVSNGAPYSGATSNVLQITPSSTIQNSNLYNCIVTGVCTNPVTTGNALLTVTTSAPNITTQPQSTNVCDLGTATFTAGTAGTAVYQWQRDSSGFFVNIHNGGPYSNANGSTLTISPVTSAMHNSNYQCQVTGCGITTPTAVATLSVTGNASFTAQSIASSICAGDNTMFSISAINVSTYQWQVNSGSGFVNITNNAVYSGASTANLSISSASASMNGYLYQCVIAGCGGTGISSSATLLTVGTAASINVQPIDNTLCLFGPGAFTIGVPLGVTCQWQVNSGSGFTNIVNGSLYNGATTPWLQISGMQASMDTYQYQCIVTGCNSSSITSNIVTLYLGSSAIITNQPTSVNLCGPGNTSITVIASNANSYSWQVNTGSGFVNLVNGPNYSNTSTATLNITGATTAFTGNQYQCIISACSGNTVTSNAVTLTVSPLAAITSQPANQTVCVGGNATFSFSATNVQVYSWEGGFGGAFSPLVNGGNITITNSTLVLSNVTTIQNNFQVKCILTDCSGTISTSTATLNVTPAVNISAASLSQNVCEGDNCNFSITALNATSYQWEVNSGSGFQSITNGGIYSNSTSSALNINGATLGLNNNLYRCVVSGCGSSTATSAPASLIVSPVSTLVSQTPSAILCEGGSTNLTITTTGSPSFQWQVNSGSGFINVSDGGIYSGATTSLLSLTNVGISENGNIYQCIYTSCGPGKISLPIPFTVQSPPVIDVQPVNENKCEEESAKFSVVASGKNLTYHWQISTDGGLSFSDILNNPNYSNANTSMLCINSVSTDMKNNYYRCAVDGCNQTVYSDPVMVDATENATTLFIPNAFSPDNDGLNDYFQISPYGLRDVKGEIFDRWGELLYEWNSLSTKWDGKYKGAVLPAGVYVYTIEATSNCADKKLEKKGTLTLYK